MGDNPASDMEGARRANIHHAAAAAGADVGGGGGAAAANGATGATPATTWGGVLVRTGVFKAGDETNGAVAVVDGVLDAVDWILAHERELGNIA